METIKFNCGCEFPIVEDGKPPKIAFEPTLDSVHLDCKKTWELIGSGNTKGIFQLESFLGQDLARKVKPDNIDELADLITIMRPGSLETMRDNKSVTQHYIDRKHGLEQVSFVHPILEPILKTTKGELLYQEQALQIAKVVAGFSLEEADNLRKAIGKKKPEEMAKMKKLFFEKAKILGLVSDEEAHIIFNGIESAQRYSFNASHAVSYALNGYLSAYAKAHFPRAFYASYLYYAKGKQNTAEEVRSLIANAKSVDIDICGPNLFLQNEKFQIFDNKVYFGICDIKGVGVATYEKLTTAIQELPVFTDKKLEDLNWIEFLLLILVKLPSDDVEAIIKVGCLDKFRITRQKMLFEYEMIQHLLKTKALISCLLIIKQHNIKTLKELFTILCSKTPGKNGYLSTKNQLTKVENLIQLLEKPPHSLDDNLAWIAAHEYELLGVSMSVSEIEACDTAAVNCSCREFTGGLKNKIYILAGKIIKMKEIVTVNGKNPGQKMCFLSIEDDTGILDTIVVFPEQFEEYKNLLVFSNKIMLSGIRGKDSKETSLIVNKVWQI